MSKKTNKGILIAGIVGAVSAVVGTGALAYKSYNKYKDKKNQNEFNLVKLKEDEFLKESLKQVDFIDAEIERLKGLIPTLIESIETELAIENPSKFAKTVENLKNNQRIKKLDIIVPLEVNNMRLDRLSDDMESLKKDVDYLYNKILKSYVSGNVLELKNDKLFDSVETEIANLGKELSSKLLTESTEEVAE